MRSHIMRGVLVLLITASVAHADTLALWTYENSPPTTDAHSISGIKPTHGVYASVSDMSTYHIDPNTEHRLGIGNGSPTSYHVKRWAPTDYFQFRSSSTGYENITVTWDMRRHGDLPEDFMLAYSLDGVNFTDAYSFSLSTTAWDAATHVSSTTFTHNLGSVAQLADAPVLYFRLVNAETTWAVSTRFVEIDNFTITGDAIPETPVTPLPLAVLGGGALLGMVGLGRGGRGRG